MIKRNQYIINLINIVLDICIILGVGLLILQDFQWEKVGIFTVCFWFALAFQGLYNTDRFFRLRQKAIRIILAGLFSMLVLSLLFNRTLSGEMNGQLTVLFMGITVLLNLKYIFMRMLVIIIRSKGWNIRHCAVVGTGPIAIKYAKQVKQKKGLGYQIYGFIGEKNEKLSEPLICGYDGLEDFLYHTEVDEVVIALESKEASLVHDVILQCERNGIRYSIMLATMQSDFENMEIKRMGSSQLLAPTNGRLDNMGWLALKRFWDIVFSFFGIIVLSPLMLIIAIGIKLSGPGTVLFRQERVGYHRRTFSMLKFRSMVPNEEEDSQWSGKEDSRRTIWGKFIRKCSLDELPQLFNVLSGSMSLIGPRPEIPFYVDHFRKTVPGYMHRHQVRPGITGWAQIHGFRGDTSIEERVVYDLWYIKNWTPWLDIRIFFQTILGGMINDEQIINRKK